MVLPPPVFILITRSNALATRAEAHTVADTQHNIRSCRHFCMQHWTLYARGPLQPHRLGSGLLLIGEWSQDAARYPQVAAPGLRALATRLASSNICWSFDRHGPNAPLSG